MITAALVSFGHFLAFFAMTAALVVTLVLLSEEINLERARRIRRASLIYGLAAIVITVFGLLRVYYFERGEDYYFTNVFFITKLILFFLTVALHIIPAREFIAWGSTIRRGAAPDLTSHQARSLRFIIHIELTGIGMILLSAALMAHAVGSTVL